MQTWRISLASPRIYNTRASKRGNLINFSISSYYPSYRNFCRPTQRFQVSSFFSCVSKVSLPFSFPSWTALLEPLKQALIWFVHVSKRKDAKPGVDNAAAEGFWNQLFAPQAAGSYKTGAQGCITKVLNLEQDMDIIGRLVGWFYLITEIEVSN